MRARWVRVGGWAGLAAPVTMALVLALLTVGQRDFLRDAGWDPVARNAVQWPSLLAAGPGGWLMSVGFALPGALGAVLACGLWVSGTRTTRWMACLMVVAAIGMVGLAFPVDYPEDGSVSWHGRIHDLAYPLVLVGTVGAACVSALAPAVDDAIDAPRRWFASASRVLVPVIVVTLALTVLEPVGQLARYAAFGAMLAWTALAGVDRLTRVPALPPA